MQTFNTYRGREIKASKQDTIVQARGEMCIMLMFTTRSHDSS